jgi:hypothetical protein
MTLTLKHWNYLENAHLGIYRPGLLGIPPPLPTQVFSHGPSHFASIWSQKMEISRNIMKGMQSWKQSPSLLETDEDNQRWTIT